MLNRDNTIVINNDMIVYYANDFKTDARSIAKIENSTFTNMCTAEGVHCGIVANSKTSFISYYTKGKIDSNKLVIQDIVNCGFGIIKIDKLETLCKAFGLDEDAYVYRYTDQVEETGIVTVHNTDKDVIVQLKEVSNDIKKIGSICSEMLLLFRNIHNELCGGSEECR